MSFRERYGPRDPVPRRRKARWEGLPRWRKARRGDDEKKAKSKEVKVEDDDESSDDDISTSTAQAQTSAPPPPPATSQVSFSTTQASQTLTSTTASSQAASTTAATSVPHPKPPAATSAAAVSISSLPLPPPPKTTLSTSVSGSAAGASILASSAAPIAKSEPPSALPIQSSSALVGTAAPAKASSAKEESSAGISASTSTNSTALVLGIIGGIAAALFIGLIIFLIRRRFKAHRAQHPAPDFPSNRSNATRSIWGSESSATSGGQSTMPQFVPPIFQSRNPNLPNTYDNHNGSAAFGNRTTMADFMPPIFNPRRPEVSHNNNHNDMATMPDGFFAAEKEDPHTGGSTLGNKAIDREERLGRVRTDILTERELGFGGGIMKGKNKDNAFQHQRDSVDVDDVEPLGVNKGAAQRDSVATSVARWKDPITWARDQARRNDTRGERIG